MAKSLLVINIDIRETRVALIENGIIAELHIERESSRGTLGNIYLGKVSRVLPGMQAAFIDVGLERAAFLHVEDLIRPDDFEAYLAGHRRGHGAEDRGTRAPAKGAVIEAEPVEAEADDDVAIELPTAADVMSEPASDEVFTGEDLPSDDEGEAALEAGATGNGADDAEEADANGGDDGGAEAEGAESEDTYEADANGNGNGGDDAEGFEAEGAEAAGQATEEAEAEGEGAVDSDSDTNGGDEADEEGVEAAAEDTESGAAPDEASATDAVSAATDAGEAPADAVAEAAIPAQAEQAEIATDESTTQPVAVPGGRNKRGLRSGRNKSVRRSGRTRDRRPDQVAAMDYSGGERTGGERTGGERTGGERTGGERTGGERTGGERTGGERTGGERTGGERGGRERERSGGERTSTSGDRRGDRRGGSGGGERRGDDRRGDRRSSGRGGPGDKDRGRQGGRTGALKPRAHEPPRVSKTTPIREVVREGQEVIVQISKEPIGTKGARVTSHISLPGRYVVYLPTVDHVGISKRIGSEKERARLREAVEAMKPPQGGIIVRTLAEGLTKKQLKADVGYLVRLWGEVAKKRESGDRAPVCLYTELDLVLKTARDLFTDDIEKIVIDNRDEHGRLKRFVEMFMPERANAVELYEGEEPIFDAYGIEDEIQRALSRKVPLPSGGHLIIDQAEALTAIDVNTGRFVGKGSKDLEETILATNLEAVEEIAYQLRFRNIGGLIILDLIDMERAQNREKVRRRMEELLAKDKAKTTLNRISDLGLIEMTRKRTRESLGRTILEPCFYCDGTGQLQSKQTVAYEILRQIRRERMNLPGYSIVVNAHPAVIDLLKNEERVAVQEAEKLFTRRIELVPRKEYHLEQFDLQGR